MPAPKRWRQAHTVSPTRDFAARLAVSAYPSALADAVRDAAMPRVAPGGPAPIYGAMPIGMATPRIDAGRTLPASDLENARGLVDRRGNPWIQAQYRSPWSLGVNTLAALTRTIVGATGFAGIDYPSGVRLGAGVVPAAGMLRLLYVDPVRAGGRDLSVAHTLKSVGVGVRPRLGSPVTTPTTLSPEGGFAEPVQFFGFETAMLTTARGLTPIMLGVAESLSDPNSIEYLLAEHDSVVGTPRLRRIVGVPRSSRTARGRSGAVFENFRLHRVRPGLAVARRGSDERIYMTVLVGGALAEEVSLVVGTLSLSGVDVVFRETDRVRVPPASSDLPDRPTVYESVPLAWSPFIERLLVMTTVGQWDARFYAITGEGTFVSRDPSQWFGEFVEDTHSGNLVAVHPETGHVYFQTAHNNATTIVRADQSITNLWRVDDLFLPDGLGHPPESWPLTNSRGVTRFLRWCGAPCTLLDWEFQRCGPDYIPSFVSRRAPGPDYVWQANLTGKLGPLRGAFLAGGGINSGCGFHRIVPVGRGASAYVFVSASPAACFISVAFVEEGPWPGLD